MSLYITTTGGNRRRTRKPTPQQWARLRFEVFTRDDFTCQMCGLRAETPPETWRGGRTLYANGVQFELDHVIPYRDGGLETVENLRLLCGPCNGKRGPARF